MKLSIALYLTFIIVCVFANQVPRSHQLDFQVPSKQHLLR
jgi:hypothetical protein